MIFQSSPQGGQTGIEEAWLSNPFDCDDARTHSSYCGYHDGALTRLLETRRASTFANVADASFRAFVADRGFPCLGAKAAVHRGTYRMGAYSRLDDWAVSAGLARDLFAFVKERREFPGDFSTYIAVFAQGSFNDESGFDSALWSTLQRLHERDSRYHRWDTRVSSDPSDAAFSFSFAGTAFFVVGLAPTASRAARRFAWPTLIFNAHEQFEHLRENGQFAGLQAQIRQRDLTFNGSVNPNLADFGRESEARQYSGRFAGKDWTCPFITRRRS